MQKLQSYRHHQQTNTQLLTGRMPCLSPNQQCQSIEGKTELCRLKSWIKELACNLCKNINVCIYSDIAKCDSMKRVNEYISWKKLAGGSVLSEKKVEESRVLPILTIISDWSDYTVGVDSEGGREGQAPNMWSGR